MTNWTEDDIGDLTGETIVVTGANSGLGLESTRALVEHGALVVAACRDLAKGQACTLLRGSGSVDLRELDLADLGSVKRFADGLLTDYPQLSVLMNNAGVMALPQGETADGFERQFGTNHLGHFALTGRLLPALLAAPAARVVTTSSGAHKMGKMNFEDLQSRQHYRRWSVYGQSKLANLLFTLELQARLSGIGSAAIAVAAHPGFSNTNLQSGHAKATGSRIEESINGVVNRVVSQSAQMGALPQLYAATSPAVRGGEYIGPDGFLEMRGYPKVVQPNNRGKDTVDAARLWAESVRLTGVDYAELDSVAM